MRALLFLFLIGLSFAVPYCDPYPYGDYSLWNGYTSPVRPADTLLGYCDWSLDPTCLFTALIDDTWDRKLFIAESIANGSFERIAGWNGNLTFARYAPDNASKGSSYTIKDAWVAVASIDPSVYENGVLQANRTGEVSTGYGFAFVVQDKGRSNDCRTEYRVCGYDYHLDTVLDGAKINSGNDALASFEFENNSESVLASMLSVNSEYLVDHYHLVLHCVRTRTGSHCWYSCDYYETETVQDGLTLTDSKPIGYSDATDKVRYILDDVQNGMAYFWINIEGDESNLELRMGNSSFQRSGYLYGTRYDNAPYNPLAKEAARINETGTYGFSILESSGGATNRTFRLAAPYSPDCTLTVASHFMERAYPDVCGLKPKAAIDLSASEGNGSLHVRILLYRNESGIPMAEKEVRISHGGREYRVRTDANGEAELAIEKAGSVVTAEFRTDFETRSAKESVVIRSGKPEIFQKITEFLSMGIVAFVLYLPLKKVILLHV